MSQTAQDYFESGYELCQNGHFEEAISMLDRSLNLAPNHEKARYNRAKAFFRLKRFESAIEDFTVLIQLAPNNPFYLSERAVACHLTGNNEQALTDLDRAVELEPNKPFRYSSRAFIKERAGDLEGAVADYEKTIELDPSDAIAHNNKGLVEEKLGYMEQSRLSFSQADKLDPAYKKTESNELNTLTNDKFIPHNQEPVLDNSITRTKAHEEKLSLKGYIDALKGIFTSKNERKEFKNFIKAFIKKG